MVPADKAADWPLPPNRAAPSAEPLTPDPNIRNEQLRSSSVVVVEVYTHEHRTVLDWGDEAPGEVWDKGGRVETRPLTSADYVLDAGLAALVQRVATLTQERDTALSDASHQRNVALAVANERLAAQVAELRGALGPRGELSTALASALTMARDPKRHGHHEIVEAITGAFDAVRAALRATEPTP